MGCNYLAELGNRTVECKLRSSVAGLGQKAYLHAGLGGSPRIYAGEGAL
jgi:hypothetical protein